jgi:hypothetical protein
MENEGKYFFQRLKRKRQTAKEEEEKELYTLDVCLSS